MLKNYFLILALLAFTLSLSGQEDISYRDANYAPDRIRSIQFHIKGLPLSLPIGNLNNQQAQLSLRFDDLYGEVSNFSYSIEHCDKNWNPTDLDRAYYVEGFDQIPILDYHFSVTGRSSYTHYELLLPNPQIRWLLSGNYLLKVYDEDEDSDYPIFTRRFMVLDNKGSIDVQLTRALGDQGYNTRQEIDFSLTPNKKVVINRPLQELSATVIQNYRWDIAVSDIRPTLERREQIIFDHQGLVSFPAGKEFRLLDLRNFKAANGRIQQISYEKDKIVALLTPDRPEVYREYQFLTDLNGRYLIENNNFFELRDINNSPSFDHHENHTAQIRSEYIQCVFALLYAQEIEDQDIYILGAFNGWQISDTYKMQYDLQHNAYIASIELKQGVYDYSYIAVPREKGIQAEDIDGNWFETDNSYTIFMYYRPFGERYDQLIAVKGFSSLFQE